MMNGTGGNCNSYLSGFNFWEVDGNRLDLLFDLAVYHLSMESNGTKNKCYENGKKMNEKLWPFRSKQDVKRPSRKAMGDNPIRNYDICCGIIDTCIGKWKLYLNHNLFDYDIFGKLNEFKRGFDSSCTSDLFIWSEIWNLDFINWKMNKDTKWRLFFSPGVCFGSIRLRHCPLIIIPVSFFSASVN